MMRGPRWRSMCACLIVLATMGGPARAAEKDVIETLEPLLERGELDAAARAMQARIDANANDDEAWFGLGITRFLQSVEGLAQAHHEYGVMQDFARAIPILRLPTPHNPEPKQVAYEDLRNMFKELSTNLAATQEALGRVNTKRDVKLRLHIGRIRLDLDGDGRATDKEAFWQIFRIYNGAVRQTDAEAFVVGLDGGDVHWLKGYTHFLSAFSEVALAHDFRELFERTGHLFYPNVKSPHEFLDNYDPSIGEIRTFVDVIAFIHLLNFPVEEPKRMRTALGHLETMIDESRLSWKRILAETDDDAEWLPNPDQTSVLPRGAVRREFVDGWHEFLDEAEAVLDGDKLIPFWRDYLPSEPVFLFGGRGEMKPIPKRGRGINLRKVFTQPRRLDVMMWVQGTGATPFLEEGEISHPETWTRIQRVFRGEFFGFAVWFN